MNMIINYAKSLKLCYTPTLVFFVYVYV